MWQVNHSAALLKFIIAHSKFKQSETEPCMFVLHCSIGILLLLVWVDDVLVACSAKALYEQFVAQYKKAFPSEFSSAVVKFAGISLDYRPGVSMTLHQRPHIELAFEKFVIDKENARSSTAASRPAVADRSSKLHYSNLALAANDVERQSMTAKPFLSALWLQ